MLITTYLFLVLLIPLLLSGIVAYRKLPRGRACPHCRSRSAPVAMRGMRLLRRLGQPIERRWCVQCGWDGFVRRGEARRTQGAVRRPAVVLRPAARAQPRALDVRSLRIDGQVWRVQLQWWQDLHWCRGRLVFIEPTGRSLRDAVQSFRGATQFDVLGQALSIPDGLLTRRVRQLLTSER
jgi:hypothetical protein